MTVQKTKNDNNESLNDLQNIALQDSQRQRFAFSKNYFLQWKMLLQQAVAKVM